MSPVSPRFSYISIPDFPHVSVDREERVQAVHRDVQQHYAENWNAEPYGGHLDVVPFCVLRQKTEK